MIGIYKIINQLNNDCYIGSSLNLCARKARHFRDLSNNKHHSTILQRAVEKYGIEKFQFEVIEECGKEVLLEREQYYIDLLNPKYNICKIAGSPLGVKQSEEARKKKRKYAIENNVIPPESTWKNKQQKVYMLNYNTLGVLQEFISLSEACKFIGKDATFASTITSCCLNKRYSAFGYRWVFSIENISKLRNKKPLIAWNKNLKVDNKKSKKVKQYNMNGNFIKEFNSVKEAEQIFGKGISNCATGKSKSSNGYIWKY